MPIQITKPGQLPEPEPVRELKGGCQRCGCQLTCPSNECKSTSPHGIYYVDCPTEGCNGKVILPK
jgi:hypothetical protein